MREISSIIGGFVYNKNKISLFNKRISLSNMKISLMEDIEKDEEKYTYFFLFVRRT